MSDYRMLIVKTEDGAVIEVSEDVIRNSKVYRDMMQSLTADQPMEEKPMVFTTPLPMTAATLRKIATWCKYYKGDPEPEVKLDLVTGVRLPFPIGNFEKSFLGALSLEELDDVMQAALFLNVRALVLLSAQTVADYIKNLTGNPEDIREMLGYERDLNEQDLEEIRNAVKGPWAGYEAPTRENEADTNAITQQEPAAAQEEEQEDPNGGAQGPDDQQRGE